MSKRLSTNYNANFILMINKFILLSINFLMTLSLKFTKIETEEFSSMERDRPRLRYEYYQMYKKKGSDKTIPVLLNTVMHFNNNDFVNLQVFERSQSSSIAQYEISIPFLIRKYEDLHQNKRNQKIQEIRRLELHEKKKKLYIHFLYKYDRAQALSGSLREIMYPKNDQSSLKFFTEYTEHTSRVEEKQKSKKYEEEFIKLDSLQSKPYDNVHDMEDNPDTVQFYKGPCKNKNAFSFCDQVEDENDSFSFVEPKYIKE